MLAIFSDVQNIDPPTSFQVVLDNLTLTLPQGKVTALCGLSGAGKSTVAALLERFYEPTGGRIYLDDSPLDELDPSWLRGRVLGFINQEPVLFATTIMENIRYGRPSASEQEVFVMKPLMSGPKACVGAIYVLIVKFPKPYVMCLCILCIEVDVLCITDGYTYYILYTIRVLYLL